MGGGRHVQGTAVLIRGHDQGAAEAQEGDKGLRDVRRTGGRGDGRRTARARHGGANQGHHQGAAEAQESGKGLENTEGGPTGGHGPTTPSTNRWGGRAGRGRLQVRVFIQLEGRDVLSLSLKGGERRAPPCTPQPWRATAAHPRHPSSRCPRLPREGRGQGATHLCPLGRTSYSRPPTAPKQPVQCARACRARGGGRGAPTSALWGARRMRRATVK